MEAQIEIREPDSIECTITLTMTLGQWKVIRDAVSKEGNYITGKLRSAINDLVGGLEKILKVVES